MRTPFVANHVSAQMGAIGGMEKTRGGKIKTAAHDKSHRIIKLTILALLGLTILGFLTFNYKNLDFFKAVGDTLENLRVMFFTPHYVNIPGGFRGALDQLLITFCMAVLSTVFGSVVAIFVSLFCAKNLSSPKVSSIIKSFVAFIRAVPTILWVLIFVVSAGLGGVSAVIGLTFHSAGYLIKAYAESIEEMDEGTIEALKACGANFWQIVFQAILPSSISYLVAWTFLRFEINFANAVAVGAAAGSGGIGEALYLAGHQYSDPRELGFITYLIVAVVILLEMVATKVKTKVR
ncbi:MAG: ABC transporter permease subunit [Dehalococcoidia bacterium]|nr:ABC transporter permease subunit [Dehalococcoidia bacterium]